VIVTFFPDRLVAALPTGQRHSHRQDDGGNVPEERIRILRRFVEEQGLRAQLRTGSLLTGELYVAFEYFPMRRR
jgi:paraquat-inducible protein B